MEMGTDGAKDEGGPVECPPEVGDKRKYFAINSDDDDDYLIAMDSSHPSFSQKRIPITTGKTVSKDLVVIKRHKLDSESDGESGSGGNGESDIENDDNASIELSDFSGVESTYDSEDEEQLLPTTRSQNKLSPLNSPIKSL